MNDMVFQTWPGGEHRDGWYFHFLSAVRPDLIERLEEYGFNFSKYCDLLYDSERLHEDLAKENLLEYFEMHTFLKHHKSKYGYVLDAEEQTFLYLKEEYAENILLRESWISLEFTMKRMYEEETSGYSSYMMIGNTVFFDGKFYQDAEKEMLYDGYYPAMLIDSNRMPNYQYKEKKVFISMRILKF